ncbi:hypothetical protein Taro_033391 [Colocasia esculenta]|uniref:Uncharacterized protein n=1 Tax=Colocasia esculenta TaxID=4460 RepID=A0A843WCC8_COLES|nr:hypothetical protein [Colocasia esculenta]
MLLRFHDPVKLKTKKSVHVGTILVSLGDAVWLLCYKHGWPHRTVPQWYSLSGTYQGVHEPQHR